MEAIIYQDEYLKTYVNDKGEVFMRSWYPEMEQYSYVRQTNVPFQSLIAMWRAVKKYAKLHPGCFCVPHKNIKALDRLQAQMIEANYEKR